MVFSIKGRVNIVITNQVIRYSYHKHPSKDGLVYKGELELPVNTIQDGVILNAAVFKEMLRKLVVEHKWRRKKLYFSVPDSTVVIRQMTIPATLDKGEAIGYIKTQLGNSIHLPFDNPALAVAYLEEKQEERDILLYAYPKEKIDSFISAFEEVGLKAVVADLTFLSVYRYYYYEQKERANHILLAHWNIDTLVLTAFHQNKAIFTRYVKTGTGTDDVMQRQLIQDQLVEIRRILDFYRYSIMNGEAGVEQLLFAGDLPYLPDAIKAAKEEFAVDIYQFELANEQLKYIDLLGLAIKQDV
ncbi:type IV pilus biogenesis protein PilM [Virgibacillus sp. W0430]|uniref:type IV pilus biogenesis protein PilM n=1 Tax=Virgibacillus sp. W0430 TaxID=3391580 RepID=UPI003F461C36